MGGLSHDGIIFRMLFRAFQNTPRNIDESTHKEILYVLVRSKACWADRNTEFINEQLNFLEEIGLYTGDMRDVSQDKCDGDGINRNLCDDYEYDMSTGLAAKTAFLLLSFSCFL